MEYVVVELLDPVPAVGPPEPDPVPEFEFDQSVPDQFDPLRPKRP